MKINMSIAILVACAAGALMCANRCSRDAGQSQDAGAIRDGAVAASQLRPVTDARPVGSDSAIDDRVARGNSTFAFGLFLNTCGSGETKNLFISPLSVSVALAMTYNGASRNTADEMAGVLGFKGVDLQQVNQEMANLTAALEQADSAVQLTVANSLWGRKGFEFRPDFLQRNATYYRAETASLDFADPGAPGVINGWVNGATRGLIDRIIDAIPHDAMLYLINAIYFKGRWQTAFDPTLTIDGPFHLAGGNEKTVPMMNRSGSFRYAENEGVQLVRLPYGSGRMGMYIILPADPQGLGGFLGTLDDSVFEGWMSKLVKREGDVLVPRFKIEYECALSRALKAMGMKEPFDASVADFSGMSDTALFISEVKHKAVVEVNEEGTKAAAVTSVEMKATSISEPEDRFSFIADRPFFFVIRDDPTRTILFMGAVYDPIS